MEEFKGPGGNRGDDQEQHRQLDVILQSEYAEEVLELLYHHYQRVRAQPPSAPPPAPDLPH